MNAEQDRKNRVEALTPREVEILLCRCEGMRLKVIVDTLAIEMSTVKKHLQNAYSKLGLDYLSQSERLIELREHYWDHLRNANSRTERSLDSDSDLPDLEQRSEEAEQLLSTEDQIRALDAVWQDEIALFEEEARYIVKAEPGVSYTPPGERSTRRRSSRLLASLALLVLVAVVGGFVGAALTLFVGSNRPLASSTQAAVAATPLVPNLVAPSLAPTYPLAAALVGAASITSTVTATSTTCGETKTLAPPAPPLLQSQGVIAFTPDNTGGAVFGRRVRTVLVDRRGLWLGYFSNEDGSNGGVGFYDGEHWLVCGLPGNGQGLNVNALAEDRLGNLWVGTEKGGVSRWDGKQWRTYTTSDGLPSNQTYGLTVDSRGNVWAATWEGVAELDGNSWSVPYTVEKGTIPSNRTHTIAFGAAGDVWIGTISNGVSQYRPRDGKWVVYTIENGSGIGGNQIRHIVVRPASSDRLESVWVATADGGVSRFENDRWTVYRESDGLPSSVVSNVAVDRYGRIWAATTKGTAYFDGAKWIVYDTLDTMWVAHGADCQGCPFDADNVWTGTREMGVTRSRLPYPDPGVDLVGIRLVRMDGTTVSGDGPFAPGEKFRAEITVRPRPNYQLREDRGDQLVFVDADEGRRYGAFVHMTVKGKVEPGEPFTFTDYENPFVAPALPDNTTQQVFTSTWQVWMYTRLVGPKIPVVFTVSKPRAP